MKLKKSITIVLLATIICAMSQITYANDLIDVTHTEIPITYNTGEVNRFIQDIVYGNDTYVAIGQNFERTKHYLLSSKDLKEWKKSDLVLLSEDYFSSNLSLIFNNGTFYLFEGNDKTRTYINLYISVDGINWTKKAINMPPVEHVYQKIKCVNNKFIFCDSWDWLYFSDDGINWTKCDKQIKPAMYGSFFNYQFKDIAYGDGVYIVAGTGYLYESTDLKKWEVVCSNGSFSLIDYGNDTFVAVPQYGNTIHVSKDNGQTWNGILIDKYDDDALDGFSYLKFDDNAFYLQAGTGITYKSYDGIKWNKLYSTFDGEIRPIIHLVNDKCISINSGKCVINVFETEDLDVYLEQAQKLNQLGLLKGTNNGFDLNRVPTRAESAVMLIRLLGKEQEVLSSNYNHPFTDVPEWCDKYIGYMYENKLTMGIGDNKYGASLPMDSNSYTTFILRALGYDDNTADFKWHTAINKAVEISLLSETEGNNLEKDVFLRSHMVGISYNALATKLKGNTKTLLTKLCDNHAIACDIVIYGNTIIQPVSGQKLLQGLSDSDVEMLKSYDYRFDLEYACDDLVKQDHTLAKQIYTSFYEIITLDDNEKFYTNERLTYLTQEGYYGIRGVYQIEDTDGIVQETYEEIIFMYDEYREKYYSVGQNLLAGPVFKKK